MKTIIRNFLRVIRRYKLAIILNILGLSIAFAAFMVIMTQIHYDYSFDRFHKDHDKIFRVESSNSSSNFYAVSSRPFAEQFIVSSPYILDAAISRNIQNCRFHVVNKNEERIYYEEIQSIVTPSYFDIFSFDFVEGSKGNFVPRSVFIPLSLSRKIFGNEMAAGRQIIHSDWGIQTVTGVYRDFPANTSVKNCLYFVLRETDHIQNWNIANYHTYIRVNDPSNIPLIIENFKRNFKSPDENEKDQKKYNWEVADIRLTALRDIHFVTDVRMDDTPKASKQALIILFAIALAIISIAFINFTNFNVSLAPRRMKTINTQRIFGAGRLSLMLSIVFEALFLSFLSFLIAILLYDWYLNVSDTEAASRVLVIGGSALFALFSGAIAGLYPAYYMTSFAPALAVKGNFGLTPKGKKLRNTMTGIQFIASFVLIIGVSFMYLQNRFMQKSDLGYDKDGLITVNISMIQAHRDVFTNQLKAYPEIEDVTFGYSLMANSDEKYTGFGIKMSNGVPISFKVLSVYYTFLKVMGIEITEGRDFSRDDADLFYGAYIFNETAKKKYNMEIDQTVEGDNEGKIIGFIHDVKFASFRNAVEPMAFYVEGTNSRNYSPNEAYIKVKSGADKRAAMSHVRATLAGIATDFTYPFQIRFFDEVLQQLYEKERLLNFLITLFSLIAIFISIIGVFGLAVFDCEYRRKEIGIRKVLGASTMGIILMFNKTYFRILAICFVIAAPLAWYAVTRWLENFAYKTPLHWWVYLLALFAVGIITVATVTFQTWSVANDNPVNSIKTE